MINSDENYSLVQPQNNKNYLNGRSDCVSSSVSVSFDSSFFFSTQTASFLLPDQRLFWFLPFATINGFFRGLSSEVCIMQYIHKFILPSLNSPSRVEFYDITRRISSFQLPPKAQAHTSPPQISCVRTYYQLEDAIHCSR